MRGADAAAGVAAGLSAEQPLVAGSLAAGSVSGPGLMTWLAEWLSELNTGFGLWDAQKQAAFSLAQTALLAPWFQWLVTQALELLHHFALVVPLLGGADGLLTPLFSQFIFAINALRAVEYFSKYQQLDEGKGTDEEEKERIRKEKEEVGKELVLAVSWTFFTAVIAFNPPIMLLCIGLGLLFEASIRAIEIYPWCIEQIDAWFYGREWHALEVKKDRVLLSRVVLLLASALLLLLPVASVVVFFLIASVLHIFASSEWKWKDMEFSMPSISSMRSTLSALMQKAKEKNWLIVAKRTNLIVGLVAALIFPYLVFPICMVVVIVAAVITIVKNTLDARNTEADRYTQDYEEQLRNCSIARALLGASLVLLFTPLMSFPLLVPALIVTAILATFAAYQWTKSNVQAVLDERNGVTEDEKRERPWGVYQFFQEVYRAVEEERSELLDINLQKDQFGGGDDVAYKLVAEQVIEHRVGQVVAAAALVLLVVGSIFVGNVSFVGIGALAIAWFVLYAHRKVQTEKAVLGKQRPTIFPFLKGRGEKEPTDATGEAQSRDLHEGGSSALGLSTA